MNAYSIPGFAEPVSSLMHLFGALVFAVLGLLLLRRGRGDAQRLIFLGTFVFSCVLLLSMSGVYHMLAVGSTGRAVLARLDHAAIFVLIAGTHTPVQGLFFRRFARWGGLAVMWAVAITGITLFSVFYRSLPGGLGTGVYLAMGWIAGGAGLVVWKRFGMAQIRLLILGGVLYSIGALLLSLDWPVLIDGIFGPHELWHVAVLAAMACHWVFLYRNAWRPAVGDPRDALRS